jgi:PAS domain S-box-containing protein
MASAFERGVARLKLGDHACPICESQAEQLAIAVPHVKTGLQLSERCQCIAGDSSIDAIVDALAAAEVDVAREIARGALVLTRFSETPYAGGADVPGFLAFLRQMESAALADGLAGLRLLGWTDWMLRPELDPDRLVEYEAQINQLVANSRTMVLCFYDRPRFDSAFIHEVLRAHPFATFGDLVCPNPYYEPPELMMNGDRTAMLELKRKRADWWIARLKETASAEKQRERAEAELREREEHIHLLLDSTAEAIYGLDLEGRCTFANPACVRLLGYATPKLLAGKNMHRLIHHSRADGTAYPAQDCPIEQGLRQAKAVHLDGEVFWRADGTPFFAECWSFPIRRGGQHIGAVVTFVDVSERKELEERLHQSQRMEALGQLTGGIAHDFNNLLTVVLGNADMLVEDLEGSQREQAEMIRSAAERGAELVNRMLAFARRQPLHPMTVDVNKLIRSMEGLLRRSLGAQIEIRFELADDAWPSLIDPSQLETAVLNLAINARDAMPQGGRIVIGTANVRLDRAFHATYPEAEPGDYVTIGVTDTGTGMSPEVLEKAVQPFFTTKEIGKGTGLGLSMVYGFAKQSEGHMEIDSEPGQGTTVTLYLPRASRQAPDAAGDEEAGIPRGARQGEVILLVEDDKLVRDYVVIQLRRLGYDVIPVADGSAALANLRERDDVQLLFTDVIMPGGLSGVTLAEQASQIRPGLKVLLTSGYSESALLQQGRLPPDLRLLRKPYAPRDLAAEIRRALDR